MDRVSNLLCFPEKKKKKRKKKKKKRKEIKKQKEKSIFFKIDKPLLLLLSPFLIFLFANANNHPNSTHPSFSSLFPLFPPFPSLFLCFPLPKIRTNSGVEIRSSNQFLTLKKFAWVFHTIILYDFPIHPNSFPSKKKSILGI